jgi:hypothetical protein
VDVRRAHLGVVAEVACVLAGGVGLDLVQVAERLCEGLFLGSFALGERAVGAFAGGDGFEAKDLAVGVVDLAVESGGFGLADLTPFGGRLGVEQFDGAAR